MAMNFSAGVLGDSLSEVAGYKAGIALSIEEMCDHLTNTSYPDIILQSEKCGVRIRSEEYEDLFYKLLHRIGYTSEEHKGHFGFTDVHKKYVKAGLEKEFDQFLDIYHAAFRKSITEGLPGPFDYTDVLIQTSRLLGQKGYEIAMDYYDFLSGVINLSPFSKFRAYEWNDPLELKKLFSGTKQSPEKGIYIDQRFINYLAKNSENLSKMHWRKFEEFTAEYFSKEGFEVELGNGGNDDGVDIRIWKNGATRKDSPLCLVQCKRVNTKVERIIVKGLYSDVEFEGAEYGVIVTTSELSPGARENIYVRGYPIQEVNKDKLVVWLETLRTPGTGIIRST